MLLRPNVLNSTLQISACPSPQPDHLTATILHHGTILGILSIVADLRIVSNAPHNRIVSGVMVRLLTLVEDVDLDAARAPNDDQESAECHDRPSPNMSSFSAALACYPIASQLASYLDLNSLHELSRACRQFRVNLLQYQKRLVAQTLRCQNENLDSARRLGNAIHASHQVWTAYGRDGGKIGRITSGKVGACARDLNCAVKAPSTKALQERHRRLCRTCLKAPLAELTVIHRLVEVDESIDDYDDYEQGHYHGYCAIARSPCTCSEEIWLCQPCGQSLKPADTTYLRGWTWRTRYSACGGLGAGLGEGNEGVECGRTRDCLAAKVVEKDVECDAAELALLEAEMAKAELEGHQWQGTSYSTQEIVGIGGKVKKKVRRQVPVGAIVKEYEDERESERFLEREQSGEDRSWCSWCDRVVLGKRDFNAAMEVDSKPPSEAGRVA